MFSQLMPYATFTINHFLRNMDLNPSPVYQHSLASCHLQYIYYSYLISWFYCSHLPLVWVPDPFSLHCSNFFYFICIPSCNVTFGPIFVPFQFHNDLCCRHFSLNASVLDLASLSRIPSLSCVVDLRWRTCLFCVLLVVLSACGAILLSDHTKSFSQKKVYLPHSFCFNPQMTGLSPVSNVIPL